MAGNVTQANVGYPDANENANASAIGAGAGAGAGLVARGFQTTLTTMTTTTTTTIVRYDYIFGRESSWIRSLFAVVYLAGNLISAICLMLLVRFYFSKKYHKVHEKNLNSTCLSLLAINVLKWANFLRTNRSVNETLMQTNVITTFLLLTTAADLYLTLKSVIKDVFVEEAASRRRFAVYSLCGWLLPVVFLRALFALRYSRRDFAFALVLLHCGLNFVTVVLIRAGLRSYYGGQRHRGTVQGHEYYSDEKYTSDVVCFLSSLRFVFHLLFLVTGKHVALSILDFFRAYEGMYVYYRLALERPYKCARECRGRLPRLQQPQSCACSSV